MNAAPIPLLILRAYEKLLLEYGTDYQEVRHEKTTGTIDAFFAPSPFQARTFAMHQEFDYEGLEGRLLSSSYTPPPGHPNHMPLRQELRRVFDAHQVAGKVEFAYKTLVYYGRLSA
jgi:hypothetical protein